MSGALIELVAKGVQDIYLLDDDLSSSLFQSVFEKHTNFSQAPRRLDFNGQTPSSGSSSSIILKSYGDLVNYMWLEGTNLTDYLPGTVIDLYIGGQKIDSHTFEYLSEAWQPYLAETYSKSAIINNGWTASAKNFLPLHFFFCDLHSYIPLIALQYHEVEIRILWGSLIGGCSDIIPYANYIYLDTKERDFMANNTTELLITQVQRYTFPAAQGSIDLSFLNHPVRTLFFGIEATTLTDVFTFTEGSLQINGTEVFNKMSPLYFHVVQSFYHTDNAVISWNRRSNNRPNITLLYMYNFCLNATSYRSTGSVNFSRIDNAKISLTNVSTTKTTGVVYAVSYNVLKIQNGLGGILFGN